MVAQSSTQQMVHARSASRRALPRLQIEELVHIARHFGPADRALVDAVYGRGLPLKALAALHNARVDRLRRRLQRIAVRVRSPMFRAVLREHHCWPAERRAIAEAAVFRGESLRVIARAQGLSLHEVRTEVERLRGLAERYQPIEQRDGPAATADADADADAEADTNRWKAL